MRFPAIRDRRASLAAPVTTLHLNSMHSADNSNCKDTPSPPSLRSQKRGKDVPPGLLSPVGGRRRFLANEASRPDSGYGRGRFLWPSRRRQRLDGTGRVVKGAGAGDRVLPQTVFENHGGGPRENVGMRASGPAGGTGSGQATAAGAETSSVPALKVRRAVGCSVGSVEELTGG